MPWVRFTADFDWRRTPAQTIAYKAGSTKLVKAECARAAILAGKCMKVNRPDARQ